MLPKKINNMPTLYYLFKEHSNTVICINQLQETI